jgi:hypothetical protein
MADRGFREDPLPLWRKAAGAAGNLQELFSDYLVSKDSKLAFLPYFLSGGHDTSDALHRIANEGINRPMTRWNRETQSVDLPRAQALGDLLSASQLPAALSMAGAGVKGATKGLSNLFDKAMSGGMSNESRREFIEKMGGAGLAGLAGLGGYKAASSLMKPATQKYTYNSLDDFAKSMYISEGYPSSIGIDMQDMMSHYDWVKKMFTNRHRPKSKESLKELPDWTTEKIEKEFKELGTFSPKAKAEAKAWQKETNEYYNFWDELEKTGLDIHDLKESGLPYPSRPKYLD